MSGSSSLGVTAGRQEAAIPGSINETRLLLAAHHKIHLPATEPNNILMSGQPQPYTEGQSHSIDNTAELEVIGKDEFNMFDLGEARTSIQSPRTNPERSARSIKKQEKTITGQVPDAILDLQDCKNELSKTKRKIATAKRASERRVQNLQKKVKDSQQDLRKCQKTVHHLQDRIEDLQDVRTKLKACQEELSACKDDLFRLQPLAQTSDSHISKEFHSLGQQIVHWIEAEVASFDQAHPEKEPNNIFSIGEDEDASTFLRQYPTAGEHLARYMVNRYLAKYMFGRNISVLGLPEETAQFLLNAEQSLARLDPPRDPATIAAWRSETVKALAATTECQKIKWQKLLHMTGRLFLELSRTFPILFAWGPRMDRFFQQVIWPAGELAVTILESPSTYVVSISDSPLISIKPAYPQHLKTCTMTELQTGKTLKSTSAVVANKNGEIGDLILELEPCLYRINENEGGTILQPTMTLVKLFHPIGKPNNKVST